MFPNASHEKVFREIRFFFFSLAKREREICDGFACRVLSEYPMHIRRKDSPFKTTTPTFTSRSLKYQLKILESLKLANTFHSMREGYQ